MRRLVLSAALLSMISAPADAQERRLVEVQFTPTARTQLALWIESADGTRFETLRLTESVAYRGVGNRPGASTMNSGFRWPYGRREGVLPVWAHRRVDAGGAPFPRVIFQNRRSEGLASRTSTDFSVDSHFCLSFDRAASGRDALDAVTCPSVFNSDKGRYITEGDVASSYSEPIEDLDGEAPVGTTRALPATSLYPPRRDLGACTGACYDHPDVASYRDDADGVMPELDAVTMATPQADVSQALVFTVPDAWPDGDYVVYLEVALEGDYNESFNATEYPTPRLPTGSWDSWAINYGYPFRGQPSVVFRLPFRIGGGGSHVITTPFGYGSVSGTGPDGGEIRPFSDGVISDDPDGAPGSGADRLRMSDDGHRLRVVTVGGSPPSPPDPDPLPPECHPEDPDPSPACCDAGHPNCETTDPTPPPDDPTDPTDPEPPANDPTEPEPCEGALICTCAGGNQPPDAVGALEVDLHPDERQAHHWARIAFDVPADDSATLGRYEVRVGRDPIVDEASFLRALPAKIASLEPMELVVPTDGAVGTRIEVEIGGLSPETHYYVGVRARDGCDDAGQLAVAELDTNPILFTTVSPCFVATAAWGTPMADEIRPLRRFRDRHLATHAVGQLFIATYERLGPRLADSIRQDEALRSAARRALRPLVWLAAHL